MEALLSLLEKLKLSDVQICQQELDSYLKLSVRERKSAMCDCECECDCEHD